MKQVLWKDSKGEFCRKMYGSDADWQSIGTIAQPVHTFIRKLEKKISLENVIEGETLSVLRSRAYNRKPDALIANVHEVYATFFIPKYAVCLDIRAEMGSVSIVGFGGTPESIDYATFEVYEVLNDVEKAPLPSATERPE